MEVRKKSKVVRKLIDPDVTKLWNNDLRQGRVPCSFPPPPCLSYSESPPKNSFYLPPPPIFSEPSGVSKSYRVSEHGESDNSFTTGSASDIEDNSDSQSDAAVKRYSMMKEYEHVPHRSTAVNCSAGSLSDTGLGGVAGSSSVGVRSSPLAINRPLHSMRGYESDGSPIMRSQHCYLPPIGVFWDIENCQVPKGRSAVAVAQLIREKFFEGRREAEFLVVCDVKKENAQVIQELNDAQVNLIHVASTCKNAADEKLRQAIRRFAEIYGSPAAIILISGDINFAADLSDLRHRKKIHVILIHNSNTSETLILCANEHYNFSSLVENLPLRGSVKSNNQIVELMVTNLPTDKEHTRIKNRLKKLSDNCGGRVGNIMRDCAIVRFPTVEFALRAQKRMDGEDVFGNKILVSRPQRVMVKDQESPYKNCSDQPRVHRNTYRSGGEEEQVSSRHFSLNSHTYQNNPFPDSSPGMFHQKNFGNGGAAEVPSATLPPFNASQTGIGTANFYRNTPPPRFMMNSGVPVLGQTANQPSVLSGWNRGSVLAGTKLQFSVQQPKQADTYAAAFASTAHSRGIQEQTSHASVPQAWQCTWGQKSLTKPECSRSTSSPLQIASQSLSVFASTLAGGQGRGDCLSDPVQHVSVTHGPEADSVVWDESKTGQKEIFGCSPLKISVPQQARTQSPGTVGAPRVQSHGSGNLRAGAADCLHWSGTHTGRKSRTPSPYSAEHFGTGQLPLGHKLNWQNSKTSPYEDVKDPDRFFHPIATPGATVSGRQNQGQASSGPVELQVTNLDQNMDAKEMKRVLQLVFREHVMVLHVSVFVQSDGNLAATVRVPSLQDAQYAISQLHRKKVGFKRIQIAHAQNGPVINPALVRSQIVSLLQEVPNHRLPLFKFRELFESRYLSSISVSDMYKLRDVCIVSEDPSGRMVTLNPEHRNTPSPLMSGGTQDGQSSMELPYCAQHYQKPNTQDKGWAEQELATLPNIRIGLKVFTQRVHSLLHSHNGRLPLPSFVNCYEAQFSHLETDESGVPLEHLVSCVSGVEMYQGIGCVKYLRWSASKDSETVGDIEGGSGVSCVSPPLAGQLALFSRELVDLLKTAPNCQLSFNRFIPAYHHHFGRQCRVADYGFTKLVQLLEALPHIVQVLGEGSKRMVTLSHRAQVRRFTSDLLRVLKSQYSKQVMLSEFPAAYQRVLNRPFDVVNYGVCHVEDLLAEVAETTVLVTPIASTDDILIAIPKREQTPDEIERTKQFASEVLQLLRFAPQCSMDFSKFIPYYHHHFGRQCRVADYGFTKLIELFEAIPHVVKISEDEEGERKVQLTLEQRLNVLGEQVASTIESSGRSRLPLAAVSEAFLHNYGYALRCDDYGYNSMEELMESIHHSVKVCHTSLGTCVGLVDRDKLHSLRINVRLILWEKQDCQMNATEFSDEYRRIFKQTCDVGIILRDLISVIEVTRSLDGCIQSIRLKPLEVFGRSVYQLLVESGGRVSLPTFESSYLRRFGTAVQPAQYGFSSVALLLQALPDIVNLKGKGQRRVIVLDNQLMGGNSASMNDPSWVGLEVGACGESPTSKKIPKYQESSKAAESPDTVLKKLIRNLSNQASPAKQRVCGERTGGPLGYRPLGFATSQQPLHSHGHHFAWGPPHPPLGGYSTFTVPLSFSPLASPASSASFHNRQSGGQPTTPPSPCGASLPLVQPPHPSELPMPQLALTSPQSWNGISNMDDSFRNSTVIEGSKSETADVELERPSGKESIVGAAESNGVDSDCTSLDGATDISHDKNHDGSNSSIRVKRKQRLAIQFNSPLIPIQ